MHTHTYAWICTYRLALIGLEDLYRCIILAFVLLLNFCTAFYYLMSFRWLILSQILRICICASYSLSFNLCTAYDF
jgi:hypothetical protein